MNHNKLILDGIEREKKGLDYHCSERDSAILKELFAEINEFAGTDIRYLAEIDALRISGSGEIIAKYITKFSSESVKSYFIPHLVCDKVKDCDKLILKLYLHFRTSSEYISLPGSPAPSNIYVRYDNAFKTLKPKRIKNELVKLVFSPRDVFYLPFTTKMLASWMMPELEELLLSYSSNSNITAWDIGIIEKQDDYYPPLSFIKRELRLIAIDGLKNYPSKHVFKVIEQYIEDPDPDIRTVAKKTLKSINDRNKELGQ